jgi:hypothetical protein
MSWGISIPKLSSVATAINLDALKEVYIKTLETRPKLYNDMAHVFVLNLRPTL